MTAASTNAQPVTLRGPLLGTTSSGCKVRPWLAASVSHRSPKPPSFLGLSCPSPISTPGSVTSSWPSSVSSINSISCLFQALSLLLLTPLLPLSCTPWLSPERLFRGPLRAEGRALWRWGLGRWEGDPRRGFWFLARVGAQECVFTWVSRLHSQKPPSGVTPPKRRGPCHLQERGDELSETGVL